jgi:hypothetical protein
MTKILKIHGKMLEKYPKILENCRQYFPKRKFPFWDFLTVVKFLSTPIFSGNKFSNFPFLEISHGCRKLKSIPENQKNSKIIFKIIKKFPCLLERAENAKNAWENYGKLWENSEINSQKFQNIPEIF